MSPKPFHLIWREQCEAAETIQARYGVESALDYLVGEKLANFVEAAEECADFVQELSAFVAEVRKLFTVDEIRDGLDRLERRVLARAPPTRSRYWKVTPELSLSMSRPSFSASSGSRRWC